MCNLKLNCRFPPKILHATCILAATESFPNCTQKCIFRNVNKEHMQEIFSTYGKIKSIEMSRDPIHIHLHRGYCYIEFEQADDASEAKKYMDGGQVDGQEITVQFVLAPSSRTSGSRRHSPPRGRGGRGPSPRRMRSPSPRRRGPLVNRRVPSPETRKDKRRGKSSSSSGSG